MGKNVRKQYGDIVLHNIEDETWNVWDVSGATHIRVSLPAEIQNTLAMQEKGYQFVDRMLDVTVNLRQVSLDLDKCIRIKPILSCEYKDDIKKIALENFTMDRRFHVEIDYNQQIAKKIIDGWVEEIPEFYLCIYKEIPIGFIALRESEDKKSAEVYLAAVDKQYRATGAALSLYANAMKVGKEKGYQTITGYISSYNTADMNLYAYFGGTFSNPRDIYLKK